MRRWEPQRGSGKLGISPCRKLFKTEGFEGASYASDGRVPPLPHKNLRAISSFGRALTWRVRCGRFDSCIAHQNRTQRFLGDRIVGGAKRRPLISPHFSKRIRSPAFGGTNCFFAKKQVQNQKQFWLIVFALIQKEFLLYYICNQLGRKDFFNGRLWTIRNLFRVGCTKDGHLSISYE